MGRDSGAEQNVFRTTGEIITFHLKTVSELMKKAPGLGFQK